MYTYTHITAMCLNTHAHRKLENWKLNRKVNASEREAREKGPAKTSTFSPATVVLFTCSLNYIKKTPKLGQFIHKSRHIFFWNSPVLSTQHWIASKCIPPPPPKRWSVWTSVQLGSKKAHFLGVHLGHRNGLTTFEIFLRCDTWPRPGVGEGPGVHPKSKNSNFKTLATYVALRT